MGLLAWFRLFYYIIIFGGVDGNSTINFHDRIPELLYPVQRMLCMLLSVWFRLCGLHVLIGPRGRVHCVCLCMCVHVCVFERESEPITLFARVLCHFFFWRIVAFRHTEAANLIERVNDGKFTHSWPLHSRVKHLHTRVHTHARTKALHIHIYTNAYMHILTHLHTYVRYAHAHMHMRAHIGESGDYWFLQTLQGK